ncbi:glutaredoxin family protein [Saccharospirillum sp. HFRX-1]|uniref:glutaredoxin family protein n=1 Tax=unclassified Saccharospirillum TaxID=2633430 RepID=UPI0037193783
MASSSTTPNLILYSTLGCHLCEQAQALLQELARSEPLQWQVVDIVDSDALMDRYAIRIPVLLCDGASDDLGWPFTLDEVRRYLRANHG